MKVQYLIGTDIGTSGTKTIIMDTKGNLVSSAYAEYGVLTSRPLWAEQWPDVWTDAVIRTVRDAFVESGLQPEEIAGLCVSGLYGGSGIPLDERMNPVRPCLIWMDRRASVQQKWVREHIDPDRLFAVTKNGDDPYYGYTKILWIRDNEPENWKKTALFLPPNAYVIYKMTGEIAIDYSSAGNIGGIFDLEEHRWSVEMMQAMGIPEHLMPSRIVSSSDVVGGLNKETARITGLMAGTPVCAGGIDCVVATLGLGVLNPGEHVAVIGTSMTWGFIHRQNLQSSNLISMPYVKDPLELTFTFGGAATAGALPKWFRDNFAKLEKQTEARGGENAYKTLDRQAAGIEPGSEGLIVLPYFMGERSPIWDMNARGTVFGLSLHHTQAHVYRAFLESVAYSLRDTMENVQSGMHLGDKLILAGGVAKSKLWKQIFADITGYPVACPQNDIEANMGDVILAGIGTGVMSYDALTKWMKFDAPVTPNAQTHKRYSDYYIEYKKLYASLRQNMDEFACMLSQS